MHLQMCSEVNASRVQVEWLRDFLNTDVELRFVFWLVEDVRRLLVQRAVLVMEAYMIGACRPEYTAGTTHNFVSSELKVM